MQCCQLKMEGTAQTVHLPSRSMETNVPGWHAAATPPPAREWHVSAPVSPRGHTFRGCLPQLVNVTVCTRLGGLRSTAAGASGRHQVFREANEAEHCMCVTTTESEENQKALYKCTARAPGERNWFSAGVGEGRGQAVPQEKRQQLLLLGSRRVCWVQQLHWGHKACTHCARAPTIWGPSIAGGPSGMSRWFGCLP